MKVLVTGGAGFIGSHVVDELISQQYEVVVVDNLSTGCIENLSAGVRFYPVDITSAELEDVFAAERPQYVIHQAAQTSVVNSLRNPIDDAKTNILGTVNVLTMAARYGTKRFVYASSAAVYGNPMRLPVAEEYIGRPLSSYGVSKLAGEYYVQEFSRVYGFTYAILRYANVYGPRQRSHGEAGVITAFIQRILEGGVMTIFGDGKQTRDFIYVKDVARANAAALRSESCVCLNIGTGLETSVLELTHIIGGLLGKDPKIEYAPARKGDVGRSCLDIAQARVVLEWNPQYSLYQGLEETIGYYTATGDMATPGYC